MGKKQYNKHDVKMRKKTIQNQAVVDTSFLNEFEGLSFYGEAHNTVFRYKRVSRNTFALVLYSLKFNTSDWILINAKTDVDVRRIIEKEWVHSIGEGCNFGEGIINIHYCYEKPDILKRIRAVEDFARRYQKSDLGFSSINSHLKGTLSKVWKHEIIN